jgi:hypothetical protein
VVETIVCNRSSAYSITFSMATFTRNRQVVKELVDYTHCWFSRATAARPHDQSRRIAPRDGVQSATVLPGPFLLREILLTRADPNAFAAVGSSYWSEHPLGLRRASGNRCDRRVRQSTYGCVAKTPLPLAGASFTKTLAGADVIVAWPIAGQAADDVGLEAGPDFSVGRAARVW